MAGKGSQNPLPFVTRVAGGGNADDPPEGGEPTAEEEIETAPGDIYASVRGQRQAIALEYRRIDKRSISVPYSYLPLLWWRPPDLLIIEYPNLFSVLLKGKEIDDLHRRIRDHRIVWLREVDAKEAAILATAVTRLEIRRIFPSRQAAIEF